MYPPGVRLRGTKYGNISGRKLTLVIGLVLEYCMPKIQLSWLFKNKNKLCKNILWNVKTITVAFKIVIGTIRLAEM